MVLNTLLFSWFPFLLFIPLLYLFIRKPDGRNRPPSPPKLPIIGNLHQLSTKLHRSFSRLSLKYGPIMLMDICSVPLLVISSSEMAREVLKTHDHVFCSRPKLDGLRRHSYNYKDIAFSPYGSYWREIRKLCVLEVLSPKRVQLFGYVRVEEVAYMIDSISASCSSAIRLDKKLMFLTDHIIQRVALGMSYRGKNDDSREFSKLVRGALYTIGLSSAADMVPFLGRVIKFVTTLSYRHEKNFRALDSFLDQVVKEHTDPNRQKSESEDIVDALLRLQSGDQFGEVTLTKTHIKAAIMDMFIAGIDTTAVSIGWTMAELVRNPRIMKKVQTEVRSCVGKKGKVEESDLDQLHYLKMVIKESLRLHPPSSILLPRESMSHCNINGYDIDPKTMVLVNVWGIGRDPGLWKNPNEFFPERFIDCSIDPKGKYFEFLPFGSGRRGCPGMQLATAVSELALANLLYCFNWELPAGMKAEDMNMDEGGIFVIHKKSGLKLVPIKYNWES
ncbi:hypothetical protein GIB67_013309 [Kingdonia uniflora]|uniref:Cytochrome P450 n=1 Tax=Kingdonia uniflora TaxID=39325 RepID=A0A7J7LQY4_9MAGN|nr:hypothetical protein GIB67_013309 [Kingdonia uniflora]